MLADPAVLQTRNVFLDTSIFIEQNYSYHGSVFQNIARLSNNKQARVCITDITVQEVISHIKADVSTACQASTKMQKDARIFRNISHPPFINLFEKINADLAISALENQFQTFIKEASIEIISTSNVSAKAVFEKYFNRQPPFGDGKKKSEFPDAFVLEALENWCTEQKQRLYVVSTDGDLKAYCIESGNLIPLQKLAEFISLVEFHDETLAPSVDTLLQKNTDTVADAISQEFQDQGFWIDQQQGEVNEVNVTNIKILDRRVLEIDQDTAVVQVDAAIKFEADITYDDLDTASYDHEEGVWLAWRQINKIVEQQETIEATVYIKLDVEEPEYFKVDHIEINTKNMFGFAIHSDDE